MDGADMARTRRDGAMGTPKQVHQRGQQHREGRPGPRHGAVAAAY
jgi:hypothetical protein